MRLEKSYNRTLVILLTICILNSCTTYYKPLDLDEDRLFVEDTIQDEEIIVIIVIPLNEIKKVEVKDSAQNTAIAITGLIGFLLVVGLIALLSSGIKLGGFSKF